MCIPSDLGTIDVLYTRYRVIHVTQPKHTGKGCHVLIVEGVADSQVLIEHGITYSNKDFFFFLPSS